DGDTRVSPVVKMHIAGVQGLAELHPHFRAHGLVVPAHCVAQTTREVGHQHFDAAVGDEHESVTAIAVRFRPQIDTEIGGDALDDPEHFLPYVGLARDIEGGETGDVQGDAVQVTRL